MSNFVYIPAAGNKEA